MCCDMMTLSLTERKTRREEEPLVLGKTSTAKSEHEPDPSNHCTETQMIHEPHFTKLPGPTQTLFPLWDGRFRLTT